MGRAELFALLKDASHGQRGYVRLEDALFSLSDTDYGIDDVLQDPRWEQPLQHLNSFVGVDCQDYDDSVAARVARIAELVDDGQESEEAADLRHRQR